MKQRFAVLVDWEPQIAGGDIEVYGTWQTFEAAQQQAKIWEQRALKLAEGHAESTPIIHVVPLRSKVRSGFRAKLAAWWEGK